jgi:hypothetical protein
MTTHELARKLLQLPDVPLTIHDPMAYFENREITDEDVKLWEEGYSNTAGEFAKGPILSL